MPRHYTRAADFGAFLMNLRATDATLPRFASVEQLIETQRPANPVYLLFPEKFRIAARRFVDSFPGDTLFAVKANPAPQVLEFVYASGVRHFDTASLSEIELVRGMFPDAQCHFMAPVRLPGTAAIAYSRHGVRDFVIDCDFELDKLLSETGGGKDCRIFVRLATPLGGAVLELSSKFGTTPEDAARLLKRVAESGAAPALTFHVGSQLPEPVFLTPRRLKSPDAQPHFRESTLSRSISAADFPDPIPGRMCHPIIGISTPSAKPSRRCRIWINFLCFASRDAP